MKLSTAQQDAIRHLRDAGVLPEATAAAVLPAKRRRIALCRNHRGSAYLPGGPCGQPVARVRDAESGQALHTLCARCLADEAEILTPDYYSVEIVAEVGA